MNEIKIMITEQLQQLQMLMHRATFQDFRGGGRARNPHRGQGRVLAILKLKPEISQRDLSYLLDMSKQSLAELLTKLEKSGYITREPSEEDKRVLTIKLTEEGRKAAENVEEHDPDTENILDCLNSEELTAFSDYLERIIKRYEALFPDVDYEQHRKAMGMFLMQHDRRRDFRSGSQNPRENPFRENSFGEFEASGDDRHGSRTNRRCHRQQEER